MKKDKLFSQLKIRKRRMSDSEIKVNFERKLIPICPICLRKMGYWEEGYTVTARNGTGKYDFELMMVCSDKCLGVLEKMGEFYENLV